MEMEKKRIFRQWNLISFFHSSTTGTAAMATTIATVIFMILVLVLPSASASASAYPSDEVQRPRLSVGRHLLQAITDCPIDFQHLNYTVITSRCKGPKYPANICCEAFKELGCPYAPTLNDITNNCATTMFSYINLYGKYPPGLFANVCRDSKRGLECTNAQMSKSSRTTARSGSTAAATPNIVLLFLLTLYCMFQ